MKTISPLLLSLVLLPTLLWAAPLAIENCVGCAIDSTGTSTCTKCKGGYKPSTDGKTCGVLAQCNGDADLTDKTKCAACLPGYYVNGLVCTAGTIANCDIYTSATLCGKCKQGYGLDNSNACVALTVGCAKVDCSACAENYIQSATNTCTSKDKCFKSDSTNVGKCQCVLGYYFDGTACVQSTACARTSFTTNKCDQCNYDVIDQTTQAITSSVLGYYLTASGTCETTSVANCRLGLTASTCSKCAIGYSLKDSTATTCVANANCIDHDATTFKCTTCGPNNYALSTDSTCAKCGSGAQFLSVIFASMMLLMILVL